MTPAEERDAGARRPEVLTKVSVVIADDHAIVRQGIASLLSTYPDIQVVAEAHDGKEALRLVQRLRPRIVLLDISMPGMNGLTAAMRIQKLSPRTSTIMLSVYSNRDLLMGALQAGARGYLTKQSVGNELAHAILVVARGGVYLSPDIASLLVADYLDTVRSRSDDQVRLTVREREVLQLIAEGRTNKQIALRLGTSVKTVDTHRTHLMRRLDIHDLAGLVRYAVRQGLVEP
jgi:DNA-binding NarL/FixJ family response regulator